jgi:hypothetical protein
MSGELKPISPARLAREIAKLSAERRNGEVNAEVYDQRFARMVGELRERRIDGSRQDVVAVLKPLLDAGDITAQEYDRLLRQIGMA